MALLHFLRYVSSKNTATLKFWSGVIEGPNNGSTDTVSMVSY